MKKNALLLFAFVLITGISCSAAAPKWEKYGSNTEIDVANIQPAGNNVYNYRFKLNNSGNGLFKPLETGYNTNVAYVINQESLNCKTRTVKTSTIESYGIDGKLIHKQNMLASKYSEHNIKQGGGYEKIYKMICEK